MPPKSRSKAEARGKKATREETPEETPEESSASEDAQTPELDPYELLDVKTDATQDEIKTAYKKLALKHHPGMPLQHPFTCCAVCKIMLIP